MSMAVEVVKRGEVSSMASSFSRGGLCCAGAGASISLRVCGGMLSISMVAGVVKGEDVSPMTTSFSRGKPCCVGPLESVWLRLCVCGSLPLLGSMCRTVVGIGAVVGVVDALL